MLLKDGKKEIHLCVKHLFLIKKESNTQCSEGLSGDCASRE